MEEITKWREKIDEVDLKILQLINERAKYALEIGKIKSRYTLPVYCPSREKQVLKNIAENNPGPLNDSVIKRLYERIIDESRRLERETNMKEQINDFE